MEAIKYMHDRNIAHRDIKMENILLNDDGSVVKLIDFGFSIQLGEGRKVNTFCGTPSYMSP
jgi:serine/threonine protein kinase